MSSRVVPATSRSSRIVLVMLIPVLSLAVLATVFLFVYTDPSGNSLSFGASEKVCHATGKEDWDTRENIAARTGADLGFGFTGTDGGYPVEHNSANHPNGLALFFGDSRFHPPRGNANNPEAVPDDAIGWVSTHTPPTSDRCLGVMTINPESPPVHPFINQGLFNVPTGGISSNGWLYGFFWTDHCLDPDKCPGFGLLDKWGHGVLARSNNDGENFVDPVPMPRDFVLSTAVDSEAAVNLPPEQRLGIYVFGVPHYRDSVPYLAYAPPGAIGDPSRWMFFIGLKDDGQPSWTSRERWELRGRDVPPPGHPDLFEARGCDRHVGEFSITWNRPLPLLSRTLKDCFSKSTNPILPSVPLKSGRRGRLPGQQRSMTYLLINPTAIPMTIATLPPAKNIFAIEVWQPVKDTPNKLHRLDHAILRRGRLYTLGCGSLIDNKEVDRAVCRKFFKSIRFTK